MVQFKECSQRYVPEQENYWKLENYDNITLTRAKQQLTRANFCFPTSASRKRLIKLLTRCERGLLSYDGCSTKELKRFCERRRLTLGKKTTRKEIIHLLELKDDCATFDRFVDLPAELRNMVYTKHYGSFKPLRYPIPPPVTAVSQQIRKATRLLFYRSCTIKVQLSVKNALSRSWGQRLPRSQGVYAEAATTRLFSKGPQSMIGNVRKLELTGPVFLSQHWVAARWCVNLDDRREPLVISVGESICNRRVDRRELQAAKDKIEAQLEVAFQAFTQREENERLRQADLQLLLSIFEFNGKED